MAVGTKAGFERLIADENWVFQVRPAGVRCSIVLDDDGSIRLVDKEPSSGLLPIELPTTLVPELRAVFRRDRLTVLDGYLYFWQFRITDAPFLDGRPLRDTGFAARHRHIAKFGSDRLFCEAIQLAGITRSRAAIEAHAGEGRSVFAIHRNAFYEDPCARMQPVLFEPGTIVATAEAEKSPESTFSANRGASP